MRSICLIGTSHLAALKHGSALISASDRFQFDFFGCRYPAFGTMNLVDGILIPNKAVMRRQFKKLAGRQHIQLDAYDAFGIAGFAGFPHVAKLCQRYRTTDMTSASEKMLLSRTLFEALTSCVIDAQAGVQLARQIRAAVDAPVILLCAPRRAMIGASHDVHLKQLLDSGDGYIALQLFETACKRLVEGGLLVLDQPAKTVVDRIFTANQFSSGSQRLLVDESHPQADFAHMNGTYGALVLESMLATLGISRVAQGETY